MRTAQNLSETRLTPSNVRSSTFGKLLTLPMDGKVDAQPLFVSGLAIPGQGTQDVVFAATEHDSVYALNSVTGSVLWHVSMLKAGESPSDSRSCSQVTPEIGVTATPVIDPQAGSHGIIYVVAMTKDSSNGYHHRLHALDLTTGAELLNGPVDIQASYPGAGANSSNGRVIFDPKQYKDRTGLLLVKGVVYTSWASHCDINPYTGWTMGYNQTTLAQTSVFNFTPNGSEAAIWGAGGGAAADSSGNLYYQLGNGTFDTTLNGAGFPSKGDFGNSFVKLALSNGALQATDYWAMYNTVGESNVDEDLGSGGVMLLPDVVDSNGITRHLGTGAGKDKNVYVFDRDNMGKFNPSNNSSLYQELPAGLSSGEFASPAYFNGSVYYGSVGDVIRAFRLNAARLTAAPSSTSTHSFAYPGTSPSISANGNAAGILWAVENSNPAVLHAYDATDLVTELYNSSQASGNRDQFGNGNKFMTPTIANGRVFVGTANSVAVFGLLSATLSSINPSTGTPGTAVNVTLTGTNFAAGSTVAVSGSGVTMGNVNVVSATQITATLTIGAAAGPYTVTVTSQGASTNGATFTVNAGTAPVVSSISPSSTAQGTALNVTLTGTNFTPQSRLALIGAGAKQTNVVVVSSTQITATFSIASTTATGPHNVYVVTSAGTSNIVPFTVTSPAIGSPTLTSVAPNGGTQGASVNVTLTGTNFVSGASVSVSGSGVGAGNVTFVSSAQITATLTIGAAATVGSYNVAVTTPNGTSGGVRFTVKSATPVVPTLTSINPSGGTRGTSVNVTLTGTNFTPQTGVRLAGLGASFSNVVVLSSTQLTVTFTLLNSAATGPHNVHVATSAGSSNNLPFTVN